MLKDFNIDPKYARTLIGLKHDHITTWYFLLMKKLNKDCFPFTSETPRTLKNNKINKFEQKYALSFIEESREKLAAYWENDQHSKVHEESNSNERASQWKYIGSNDDLNSSLK